jgi:hypothetical protein
LKILSDDACCQGTPLRDHDDDTCANGCDFRNAVFQQALRDTLAGISIGDRFAFEQWMRSKK